MSNRRCGHPIPLLKLLRCQTRDLYFANSKIVLILKLPSENNQVNNGDRFVKAFAGSIPASRTFQKPFFFNLDIAAYYYVFIVFNSKSIIPIPAFTGRSKATSAGARTIPGSWRSARLFPLPIAP